MRSIAAIAFGLTVAALRRPMAAFKLIPAMAAALVLASCAREASKPPAPASPQTLVGTSKQHLLACAGQPAVDYEQAGREYMTYRRKLTVGEGYLQGGPTVPVIGTLSMGSKGNEILCEASFVLKAGVVEALAFRSDPQQETKTTATLCTPLVAPCLQP